MSIPYEFQVVDYNVTHGNSEMELTGMQAFSDCCGINKVPGTQNADNVLIQIFDLNFDFFL